MRKRLLLLLLACPLLAYADPHYGDYGFLIAAIQLFVVGVVSVVVAQVVGRVLQWLMGRRFNLWILTMASLTGCWLGMHKPLNFNQPEPIPQGTVMTVAGPSAPGSPSSMRYLAVSSAAAVILTALTTALIAFLEQRNQYPDPEN